MNTHYLCITYLANYCYFCFVINEIIASFSIAFPKGLSCFGWPFTSGIAQIKNNDHMHLLLLGHECFTIGNRFSCIVLHWSCILCY